MLLDVHISVESSALLFLWNQERNFKILLKPQPQFPHKNLLPYLVCVIIIEEYILSM